MAKKIKFSLQMKDGYKVRTMEELRIHSDSESLIEYFFNGKLKNWLRDRAYKKELDEINKLKLDDDNLLQNIFNILNINQENNDIEKFRTDDVFRKLDILSKVKQYTNDDEILNNIDYIATSQIEFENMLKRNVSTIYLLGNTFVLPDGVENIFIKGINRVDIKVNSKDISYSKFKKSNINFENCMIYSHCSLIEFKATIIKLREKFGAFDNYKYYDNYDDNKNPLKCLFGINNNKYVQMILDYSFDKRFIKNSNDTIKSSIFKIKNMISNISQNIAELTDDTQKNKKETLRELIDEEDKNKKITLRELIDECSKEDDEFKYYNLKSNFGGQVIFFALMILVIDKNCQPKEEVVIEIATKIGFNYEMIMDWAYVIKMTLNSDKIDFDKLNTEDAKMFFKVLV